MFQLWHRSLYYAVTTMTTVGYGDIQPSKWYTYCVSMFMMLMGILVYGFVRGELDKMVKGNTSLSYVEAEEIDDIEAWLMMR